MKRQPMSDGTWFDRDTATCYEEAQEFDGRNMISLATGSQWAHEELYRTKAGAWVLHHWSQWQGSVPRWKYIEEPEAQQWLIAQKHADAVSKAELERRERSTPGFTSC